MNDAELLDQIRAKSARLNGHDELSPAQFQTLVQLIRADIKLTGADRDFDWGSVISQ